MHISFCLRIASFLLIVFGITGVVSSGQAADSHVRVGLAEGVTLLSVTSEDAFSLRLPSGKSYRASGPVIIRRNANGWKLNDREVSLKHSSLACPIYNASGDVAACLSMTGNPKRVVREERQELVGIMLQAAEDISVSMGHYLTSMAAI